MVRKSIAWLIPTVAIAVFGTNLRAQAQTTKNFEIQYNTLTQIVPFQPGFARATITGKSSSPAAFGLDSFLSNTYGREDASNFPIVRYNFNSEPTAIGLPSTLPSFSDRYFGGANELFGKADDSAEVNLATGNIQGAGTITIFGGTGVFENATGKITFTQQDAFDPSNIPPEGVPGVAILKFDIQTPTRQVPEYTPTYTLVSAGLIGAVLLKRGKRQKASNLL
ncbi:MAG: hypothetical protein KME29_01540 [Calothrix sp. FI2-JRJ7]|jgi:hypothetical protein|nr:hypothetical protein [Calothrix sp. FI2-JRJ7]